MTSVAHRRSGPDPLERLVPYLTARFADDPHVSASALYDELVPLDYDRSYPSFIRQLRAAGLRPHCEACDGVRGRETIDIAHPAGEGIRRQSVSIAEAMATPGNGTYRALGNGVSHTDT